jgi:hypothetical protein
VARYPALRVSRSTIAACLIDVDTEADLEGRPQRRTMGAVVSPEEPPALTP